MKSLLRVVRPLTFLLLVSGLSACSAAGYQTPGEKLQEAVFRYNNSIRWGNYVTASEYIPTEERAAYVDRRRDLQGEIKVLEWDINDVKHIGESAHADVTVTFTYTRRSSNIMESATFLQDWNYGKNKQWVMDGQEKVERETKPVKLEDRF